MDIEKLLRFCIERLIEQPSRISITQTTTNEKTIYEVRVPAQDLARVIGKEGRTFKALRALINLTLPEGYYDLVLDSLAE